MRGCRLNTRRLVDLLTHFDINTPETSRALDRLFGGEYAKVVEFFDETWQRAGGTPGTFAPYVRGEVELTPAEHWMLQGTVITEALAYAEWCGKVEPEQLPQFSYLVASTIYDREFTYGDLGKFWPQLANTDIAYLHRAFLGLKVLPVALLRAVSLGKNGVDGEYMRLISGGVYDLTVRAKSVSEMFAPADISELFTLGVPWSYANALCAEWSNIPLSIAHLWTAGVPIEYATAAVDHGAGVDEIVGAWSSGIPLEYAMPTFDASRGH